MNKNLYNYNSYGTNYLISLHAQKYANNERLAIQAVCEGGDDESILPGVPFARITVNLDAFLKGDKAKCNFIDINNLPGIEQFLQKNGIAKPTGYKVSSGFCIYPEYEFDLNKLN